MCHVIVCFHNTVNKKTHSTSVWFEKPVNIYNWVMAFQEQLWQWQRNPVTQWMIIINGSFRSPAEIPTRVVYTKHIYMFGSWSMKSVLEKLLGNSHVILLVHKVFTIDDLLALPGHFEGYMLVNIHPLLIRGLDSSLGPLAFFTGCDWGCFSQALLLIQDQGWKQEHIKILYIKHHEPPNFGWRHNDNTITNAFVQYH